MVVHWSQGWIHRWMHCWTQSWIDCWNCGWSQLLEDLVTIPSGPYPFPLCLNQSFVVSMVALLFYHNLFHLFAFPLHPSSPNIYLLPLVSFSASLTTYNQSQYPLYKLYIISVLLFVPPLCLYIRQTHNKMHAQCIVIFRSYTTFVSPIQKYMMKDSTKTQFIFTIFCCRYILVWFGKLYERVRVFLLLYNC